MRNNKRLIILPDAEVKDIYDYPEFSDTERKHFFYLTENIRAALETFEKTEAKVYLILQWGYFNAKKIIYPICFEKSRKDIAYIMTVFFPKLAISTEFLSKNTRKKIKERMCDLFLINPKTNIKAILFEKATHLIKYNTDPIHLLRELFLYLDQNNIPLPTYKTLQTLIGSVIATEEKRLLNLISQNTPADIKKAMDDLLIVKNGLSSLSALKADPKNFKTHQIQGKHKKHVENKKIFEFGKEMLSLLDISKQNVKFYASLAMHYDAYKLSKFKREKFYLYLLCFICNQHHKINNNLIDGFVHYVRSYDEKADKYMRDEVSRTAPNTASQKKASEVLALFEETKFDKIPFLSIKKNVFGNIAPEETLKKIRIMLGSAVEKTDVIWNYHHKNHRAVVANLRPLFMVLNFEHSDNDSDLKIAVDFLRAVFAKAKPLSSYKLQQFPLNIIPDKLKPYFITSHVTKKGKVVQAVEPSRYEYLVYQELFKSIDAGTVFLEDSVEYKSLASDLQLKRNWMEIKEEIIKNSHVPALENDISEILKEAKELLNYFLERVNTRIKNGENKELKIKHHKEKTSWTLPYKKMEDEINNPFYDQIEQINIADLLAFVDTECNFSRALKHRNPHRSHKDKNYQYILACLIANATGIGINKLAESSKLSFDVLFNIQQSHFSLENLRAANDIITNKTANLPIFKHYNLWEDIIHGSADGQKYDTRLQTFINRFLRKYFKEKGVAAYTLSINHVPVRAEVITGHESHFLFDIISNNTTDIQPNIVSTDTEGSNQVNFAFLDLKAILFAPCYKTITSKAKLIGAFKETKQRHDDIIKPSKIFDENLITEEWGEVQKIFTAALAGESSQRTIVKKLSSHKRKSRTKDALWEYNNILMSIYLLFYIDNLDFKRSVRVSLNRGEAYHQLRRAISNVSGGDFRGTNEMEIHIWNECARLVANAIIYYNANFLSQVFEIKEKEGDEKAVEFLKRISPAAWQHINFLGMYDFSKITPINVEEILSTMISQLNAEMSKINAAVK